LEILDFSPLLPYLLKTFTFPIPFLNKEM